MLSAISWGLRAPTSIESTAGCVTRLRQAPAHRGDRRACARRRCGDPSWRSSRSVTRRGRPPPRRRISRAAGTAGAVRRDRTDPAACTGRRAAHSPVRVRRLRGGNGRPRRHGSRRSTPPRLFPRSAGPPGRGRRRRPRSGSPARDHVHGADQRDSCPAARGCPARIVGRPSTSSPVEVRRRPVDRPRSPACRGHPPRSAGPPWCSGRSRFAVWPPAPARRAARNVRTRRPVRCRRSGPRGPRPGRWSPPPARRALVRTARRATPVPDRGD